MSDLIIKVDTVSINFKNSHYVDRGYDFWFDEKFYLKNERLKLSNKEKLRREKLLEIKHKFNTNNE